jgi:hypothetical protein
MGTSNRRAASPWTPEKVEATRIEILKRAARDASFRQRCLEQPQAAIKEVSGLEPPPGAPRIRFVERLDELVIVLPPLVQTELSDQDLALVSGGLQAEAERISEEMDSAWGKIKGCPTRGDSDGTKDLAKDVQGLRPG